MLETRRKSAVSAWLARLSPHFKVSLTLGGIAALLAIAAGLRLRFVDATDPLAWKLPLRILLLFSTWFLTSYCYDRIMQSRFPLGGGPSVDSSPFDPKADEAVALRVTIAANGLLLVFGSVLVVILACIALFSGMMQT